MKPKVSVIIPVYNVEKYLKKCVDSVLNQSYQDFEVILVDDGSTDNSGKLCDEFKSEKVTVIHKENGGLSDARNAGTEIAKGEYVTWIDSDDTIHADYIKILISMAEEYHTDMSIGEILSYKENTEIVYEKKDYKTFVFTGHEAFERMLRGKLHSTSACGFLIKTELAQKYTFPYGKYHEDDFTTYKYFLDSTKVAYIEQPLYFYMQREGSIMHKPFGKSDIDELDAADDIYNVCITLGKKYEKAALVKKTGNYCQVLLKNEDLKKIDYKSYNRINDFFRINAINIMFNYDISFKRKVQILLARLGMYHKIKNVLR